MKKPTVRRLWPMLCAVLILSACKKEVSQGNTGVTNSDGTVRTAGTLPDDPALVAKVPLVMSSSFSHSAEAQAAKGGPKKDTDGDGIPDISDACPTQPETYNGYQDTDGCPDTLPPATATDTDGDGIPDASDACPTQPETFNGYQDTDGCPDTVPDTDGDGIIDTKDACPTQPETYNGYQDDDGCPDTVPTVLPTTSLPASYQLQTPPVGNQGGEGSCVAFATAYDARSIEQYYRTGAGSYSWSSNIFSPEYVYNQIKFSDCGSGSAITTALDLIQSQGVSTWQAMPYNDYNGCSTLPDASQTQNASAYKISSYVKMANTDQQAIKTMIAGNHPVITTVIADNSFVNAGPGFIWKAYSGSGALPHTLIFCGYDDAKHAYKVMNSWGTTWGDAGYSWIDYDFYPQKSSYYAYAIQ